jgi:hypothetical protein
MPQHVPPGTATSPTAQRTLNISAPFPTSDPLPANLTAAAGGPVGANGAISPAFSGDAQTFNPAAASETSGSTAGQYATSGQDASHHEQSQAPVSGRVLPAQTADSSFGVPSVAGGPTYGVDLGDQLARDGGEVPRVVEKCVQAVEAYGAYL